MALQIVEFFGLEPLDPASATNAAEKHCPFIGTDCTKPNHGSCSVRQLEGDPIICCPNRMYAGKYRVLLDVSDAVFGAGCTLIHPAKVAAAARSGKLTGKEVAAFGRHWGQELALPRPAKKGSGETSNYWVDWILARINKDGSLAEFTAVEVQTIDTTGSYKVLHGRLNIITNNSSNISKFDIDTV